MPIVLAVGDKAQMLSLPRMESRAHYRKAPHLIVGAFSMPPGALWGRLEYQKSWDVHEQMTAALKWTKAPSVAIVLDAQGPTSSSQTRRLLRISNRLIEDLVVDARNFHGMDITAFGVIVNCTESEGPAGQRVRSIVDDSIQKLACSKAEPGPAAPMSVEAWHLHDHALGEIFQQADL